jgi:hypothetical protein
MDYMDHDTRTDGISMSENKILKQSWCELLENIVMVKHICLSFFKFEKKFLVA